MCKRFLQISYLIISFFLLSFNCLQWKLENSSQKWEDLHSYAFYGNKREVNEFVAKIKPISELINLHECDVEKFFDVKKKTKQKKTKKNKKKKKIGK